MTSSKHHRSFVSEPIMNKSVDKLPGIGETLGKKLTAAGFTRADKVLGQFLLLDKERGVFIEWLKEITDANDRQSDDCYTALKEWCESHFVD